MNPDPQTANELMQGTVPPSNSSLGEKSPVLSPMRGVTVGSLNDVPTGPRSQEMRRSAQGQGTAAVLFFVALLPAIILCLMFGLSHRVQEIPASPVWAWFTTVIALFLVVRTSVLVAIRSTSPTAWMGPILLLVLLLIPASAVLYLRLTLHSVGAPLATTQVALYGVSCCVADDFLVFRSSGLSMRFLLLFGVLTMARLAAAQESHIGGAQASDARVVSPSETHTTNATGTAHVVVTPSAKGSHSPSKPEPAVLNAPSSPDMPVELSDAAFAQLILHRQAAVYPNLARSTHAEGAVVLDVVLDQNGYLESADPIGAEDFSIACMQAIQTWKFAPYRYQGRPWKVSGSIRFNFINPSKGTSD